MSQAITARRVVYEMPDEAAVVVRRDIEFSGADGQPLTLDLYLPTDGHVRRTPVVLLIAGFPDAGTVKMLGCRFKEMQSVVSWATLLAASGVAAVAYANREQVGDLAALIDHLTAHAAVLNIDEESVGLLSTSGHGPLGGAGLLRGGGGADLPAGSVHRLRGLPVPGRPRPLDGGVTTGPHLPTQPRRGAPPPALGAGVALPGEAGGRGPGRGRSAAAAVARGRGVASGVGGLSPRLCGLGAAFGAGRRR